MKQLHVTLASPVREYDIKIGRGLLSKLGRESRRALGSKSRKVAIVSNRRVADLYAATVTESLRTNSFDVSCWLMGDGERFKSLRTLAQILDFLSAQGLERGDAVLALGGGVVGDLAGFAASAYLRGIEFIQAPTTLLAQIDSSVGGKTGVNLPAGKNLVGAFYQPRAVIIDTQTLATLPRRELTAGWCEVVKTGAISGRVLLESTMRFLNELKLNSKALQSTKLELLVAQQCAFKASIVARDERESPDRKDRFSRRILNFGHTVGHALEAVTKYRRFKHGEAVGHGILVAGEISKNLGLLSVSELELLRDGIRLCGPLPSAGNLGESAIIEAIGRDKKSVAGSVQWVLLEGIGRPLIVDGDKVKDRVLRASLRTVLRREL